MRSVKWSVDFFCRTVGDAVAGVVDTADHNQRRRCARSRCGKALRRSLDRVTRCRTAIESQVSGAHFTRLRRTRRRAVARRAVLRGRGVEEVINQADDPRWMDTLRDDIAASVVSTMLEPRKRPEGRHPPAVIGRGRT